MLLTKVRSTYLYALQTDVSNRMGFVIDSLVNLYCFLSIVQMFCYLSPLKVFFAHVLDLSFIHFCAFHVSPK